MLTSRCAICRAPKTNYADANCPDCMQRERDLNEEFVKEFPEASDSDRLYAVRMAMQQNAKHARSDWVDPRTFRHGVVMLPEQKESEG